jgi:hypothetical protein
MDFLDYSMQVFPSELAKAKAVLAYMRITKDKILLTANEFDERLRVFSVRVLFLTQIDRFM